MSGWDDTAERHRLSEELGLPAEMLTGPVLRKIATDPLFVHHLRSCATEPRLLQILLREADPQAGTAGAGRAPDIPTAELVGRAVAAFGRWAGTGFRFVPEDVQARRSAACASCTHLTGPGASLVYKIGRVPTDRPSTCGLCGCDVRRKVRLASETCPADRWDAAS